MRYYQAQDTFTASLDSGSDMLVTKGQALPEGHELVRRDLDAGKRNPGRVALFAPLGDDEPPTPQPVRRAVPRAAK